MQRQTIAFFIPSFSGGGAEKMMIFLANEFLKREYKVYMLVNRHEGQYLSLINNDIEIHTLHQNKAKALFKLTNFLYKHKPKFMISALFDCNILSIMAKLLYFNKVKLIITERNFMGKGNGIAKSKYFVIEMLKKVFYRFSDKAVGISQGISEVMNEKYRVKKSKCQTIHNPVYSQDLIDLAKEDVREPWLQNPNIKVIISVGRLVPVKDYFTLLKAFQMLEDNENMKLIILGEGSERNNIEKFVEENGMASSVKLLGFVSNPYKYIKNSDLFVLSSLSEGFGNVIVEALSLGVPIACTDCPTGPKDIIASDEYGILVPLSNPELLSKAMEEILKGEKVFDKALLQKRAMDFSIENITDRYENIL